MATGKGPLLEELVRAYFDKQGFFALRNVPLRFEGEDVTDVDIWLYSRQSATMRTRAIVDVKNKKSPRALERILWTKGLQALTGADRAIVVTTDGGSHVVKLGADQRVAVLTKAFLTRLEKTLPLHERKSSEDLLSEIRKYAGQKADGDWIRKLEDSKSGLISTPGFPAFNRAMTAFGFFAERVETRPMFSVQAARCALLCAAIACISLDMAIERVVFEEASTRYRAIFAGVTYGDGGDGRIQRSIESVLSLIEESMENGRVIGKQAREHIDRRFAGVRADLLAEYFSREHNAAPLVAVARELESHAHCSAGLQVNSLSAEARSIIGLFADFARIKRQTILNFQHSENQSVSVSQPQPTISDAAIDNPDAHQSGKLL